MKNLASRVAAGALALTAGTFYTGCSTNTTIYEQNLTDNYQRINAPTLGAIKNPNVDGGYQVATPDVVKKGIPENAGMTTPLETQLLYFNDDNTMPGRQRVTGAAGFSIDDCKPGNSEYMVMFIDKKTEPDFRKGGIAYDTEFDIYVDFVSKESMQKAFGTDPSKIPLVFIEDTDNSYKAFAATSAAEAGIFTLASGGNWPAGLAWGGGSFAIKSGTHYLTKDDSENVLGRTELARSNLTYGQPNVELFNDLQEKLGGFTNSVNDERNGLTLFSYHPEAFNEMILSEVNEEKPLTVDEGLVEGLESLTFQPQFKITAIEKDSPSYAYLIGLVASGVGGYLTGNDSGSSHDGGNNGGSDNTPTIDVIGGPGGIGQ